MWETFISWVQIWCYIVHCKTSDELFDDFKRIFTTCVHSHSLILIYTSPFVWVMFSVFKGKIQVTMSVQSRKVPSHFRITSWRKLSKSTLCCKHDVSKLYCVSLWNLSLTAVTFESIWKRFVLINPAGFEKNVKIKYVKTIYFLILRLKNLK